MITIGDKQFRNLEEQVKRNQDDIKYILEEEGVLNQFGIKVIGQVDTQGKLPDASTYEGEYGDAYAVGTQPPYEMYIYTREFSGETGPQWFNIGEFPAPSTVPGPAGAVGPTGPTGTRGSTWSTGTFPSMSGREENDMFLNTSTGDVLQLQKYSGGGTVGGLSWITVTNIRGPQGIQGPQGIVGPQGPQGIQGPKGDTGEAGQAFVIVATVPNENQLPDPSTIPDNQAYLVGTDDTGYDLYVQLQGSSEWQNVGKVEGVVGPQGPQGAQGPQGPQGPQGEQGPAGPTGPMPELASARGTSADVAMSQQGIENIFYGNNVQLGSNSSVSVTGTSCVAIGKKAETSKNYSTALGAFAKASGPESTALGYSTEAKGSDSTAIGYGATANGINSIAIGLNAESGDYSIALGSGANANGNNSIQLGTGNNSTPNTFQVGSHQLLDLSTGLIPQERIPSGGGGGGKQLYFHSITMVGSASVGGEKSVTSNVTFNIISDKSDSYDLTTLLNYFEPGGGIGPNVSFSGYISDDTLIGLYITAYNGDIYISCIQNNIIISIYDSPKLSKIIDDQVIAL